MNKVELYICYLNNVLYFFIKKILYRKKIKVSFKELISNKRVIKIKNNGYLELGEKINSRRNFSLLVDGGVCTIGKNCFFNNNVSITCLKNIRIGEKCTFGNNVVIVDHDHNFKDNNKSNFISERIIIKDKCWIGANVVILKGSNIGENCVVAAGSIVNGNIPDNSVYIQKRQKSIIKTYK